MLGVWSVMPTILYKAAAVIKLPNQVLEKSLTEH